MRARISDSLRWESSTALCTDFQIAHAKMPQLLVPIIASGLGSLGISAGVANILAGIAISAVVMGLQYLMAPKPPKPEDGKAPKQQAMPPRIYGVGLNRVAGYYMLWEEYAGYLFAVLALAGHPIQGFERSYLHDDEVTITGVSVDGLDDGRYGDGYINLETRLGATPETYYSLHVDAFWWQGIWTANHRGDGTASAAMRLNPVSAEDYSRLFPNGIPQPSFAIRMAKVFDPRDGTQAWNNPATWKYSVNPVLHLIWHKCFNPYGEKHKYERAILPVLARWVEEADICDEPVELNAGGTEPRYECHGWSTTEQDPKAFQNMILGSCDGHLVERGDGALILTVGKFREELVEDIYDADIVGHFVQSDVPEEDEINMLIPTFTYPDTDFTTTDTMAYEDVDAQLAVGRVLTQKADYGFCQSWTQARRLGWRDFRRAREKQRGSFDLRLSGLNACYARWVRVNSIYRIPRLNGAIIENRRSTIALLQGGCRMEWIRNPSSIDLWEPSFEGVKPLVPAKPNSAGLTTPEVISVTSMAYNRSVYLRVVITDPGRSDLKPVTRYRVTDVGGGTPGEWVITEHTSSVVDAGTITLDTQNVPNDTMVDVQAAFKGAKGGYSNWSLTESIFTTSDPIAPDPVTDVLAAGTSGGVVVNFTAPNSSNYYGSIFYWSVINSFGTATLSSGVPETGAANGADTLFAPLTAGWKYGWVVAVNGSNVQATPVATGAFFVS